ncbi:MAG: transglutaminase family protein [Verrucomicrobiales bacterium]
MITTVAPLEVLLRLLDDDSPEVRAGLEQALAEYEGDASDALAGAGITLSAEEAGRLSALLLPGRMKRLREEWIVPANGLDEADGDWESFESLLRQVSDFLHDGVSLRPSLPDQLDLLAAELRSPPAKPYAFARALFGAEYFTRQEGKEGGIGDADLASVIEKRRGTSHALVLIYLLVARRFGVPAYACLLPSECLAMIEENEVWWVMLCGEEVQREKVSQVLAQEHQMPEEAHQALSRPATLRELLQRLLQRLSRQLAKDDRLEEAALIRELHTALN